MNGTLQLLLNISLYVFFGFLVVYVGYYKILLFFFRPHHKLKVNPKIFPLENRVLKGEMTIKFMVPEKMKVKLSVKNNSELIKIISEKEFEEGIYEIQLNDEGLSSGNYFLCLESKDTILQRSFLVE